MTGQTPIVDVLGGRGRLYGRYASNAVAALSTTGALRDAHAEWERFFVTSHGDIFDEIGVENPRETLFVDTLYYDLVVDRLIESVERRFGVRVRNREASDNTDALPFEFRSLQESVTGTDSIGRSIDELLRRVEPANAGTGLPRELYESIAAHGRRLRLGEYYTPVGVSELAVGELDVDDFESETFLDPACGSGVFLAACIDAKRDALEGELPPEVVVDSITNTVYGIDLNPVAVKSAKLTYLLALLPLLGAGGVDRLELPVFLTDALGVTRDDEIRFGGDELDLTVDHVVGNPPWITWGNLSERVRDAWRETYVTQLELVPHHGVETRLGHANDDISVPFVWVCIHRYLDDRGDASFVLKRDITKGPAGRLFRAQRVRSRPVAVRRIHDFNRLRPFGADVAVHSAIYTLDADTDAEFPIPTDSWTRATEDPEFSSIEAMRDTLERDRTGLVPVDGDDPPSSWVREDAENRALGACEHDIRHGVKDDAQEVYSIDRTQLAELEHDHVYPYINSRHVVKYGLFGHDLHLVPMRKVNRDNEAELARDCPKTHEYLRSNKQALDGRSSAWLEEGPFYNVFGLGAYTWSDYKVVWCRLGFKPHFAVVSTVDDEDLGETTVVPGDHFMFIPTDDAYEAHFLTALLNSSVYQKSIEGMASDGKASLSKALISRLALPEYRETEATRRLADLSMEAHEIVPQHTDVSKRAYNKTNIEELELVQAEIDGIVEAMLSEGSVGHGAGRSPQGPE
ncbi:hypothetical protein GCM10008995_18030 [Halobellus salinus]|uniref:DNA methylase adenine-specific domain-containing protein n=1 Tax=Halobellus salinus TaxID=931585 RepID=A0A830EQZ8_9EURY|nr:N-6 DNA methylase [Halobellus salinus]GGJ08583.1 hypothetical protein GCM10008995_18030 [Halobellus salinus]SMP28278.1 N-6 DNA Methylase [Halobellus salinus]